eukprot:5971875-Ditylum_brightwellii.AAC.1
MDGKVEEVISNFRIFAESTMKGKKKEKGYCVNLYNMLNKSMHPEMHEIGNKFFEQKKGKKKLWYAACTLEYYPKASDIDEETREGC